MPMPLITIEELPEIITLDTAEKHMMQVTQRKRTSASAYRAKKLLRTKHLNEEEKRALEQSAKNFAIHFTWKITLICTLTVSHEINTRTDSALVNVCPYHLSEKHKKEVRQIEKMLDEGIIRLSISQWNASILIVS